MLFGGLVDWLFNDAGSVEYIYIYIRLQSFNLKKGKRIFCGLQSKLCRHKSGHTILLPPVHFFNYTTLSDAQFVAIRIVLATYVLLIELVILNIISLRMRS
jgi:hypothetical protein